MDKKIDELIKDGAKILLSDEELNEVFEEEVEALAEMVKKPFKKSYYPMGTILQRKLPTEPLDRTVVVFTDFPEDGKQHLFKGLGAKFFANDPHKLPLALFFVSEVWSKKFSKGQILKGKVSDEVDKQEGIALMGTTFDNRSCFAYAEIKRNKKGEITKISITQKYPYDPNKQESMSMQTNLLRNFYLGWGLSAHIAQKHADEPVTKKRVVN